MLPFPFLVKTLPQQAGWISLNSMQKEKLVFGELIHLALEIMHFQNPIMQCSINYKTWMLLHKYGT